MYKGMSAIAVAAIIAATFTFMPSFAPEVEARAPAPVVKSDRLDARPRGAACSQKAWPYYEAGCLRDTTNNNRPAKTVRVVSADRVSVSR